MNLSLPTYSLVLLFCVIFLSSCVTHKELLHFSEGEFPSGEIAPPPPMIIQIDDLLAITVNTLDEESSAPFNLEAANVNAAATIGGRPLIGYLVDTEGNIDFPVLGQIAVAGLTVSELKERLRSSLTEYLVNPVINIRFLNFRIVISGQVNSPGGIIMPNERVTILDAIGLAGDLTNYANRSNILIVREQDGSRTFGRVNLLDKNIFNSPYFYLRQNDYIYIEPVREVTSSIGDQASRILPWVSLVTSVVTFTLALSR